MDVHARLESALRSGTPRARLQVLMSELLELGLERDEIFSALEAFRAQLAEENRAEDEDLIDEVIDGFTGWCNLP